MKFKNNCCENSVITIFMKILRDATDLLSIYLKQSIEKLGLTVFTETWKTNCIVPTSHPKYL